MEPEITEPVELCDARGRLNPRARGWSRVPLHRANLRGAPGRKKRWDYWCVTSDDLVVALTYADVDYLGVAALWVLERASGVEIERVARVPFARGFRLADRADVGETRYTSRDLLLHIAEHPEGTGLSARASHRRHGAIEVDLFVQRPAGHESLGVVIPWSPRRFQYTSKQNTRPAAGTLRIGQSVHRLGPHSGAYGTLDFGRGIWPYATRWNWGSASGSSDGHTIGLQLGGKWTQGTGFTENALCIDGRLHKISEELIWEYDWDAPLGPWRVRTPDSRRIDVTLTPHHDRHARTRLGLLSTQVHQCFGRWEGRLELEDGMTLAVDGLLGWAEEARHRW